MTNIGCLVIVNPDGGSELERFIRDLFDYTLLFRRYTSVYLYKQFRTSEKEPSKLCKNLPKPSYLISAMDVRLDKFNILGVVHVAVLCLLWARAKNTEIIISVGICLGGHFDEEDEDNSDYTVTVSSRLAVSGINRDRDCIHQFKITTEDKELNQSLYVLADRITNEIKYLNPDKCLLECYYGLGFHNTKYSKVWDIVNTLDKNLERKRNLENC